MRCTHRDAALERAAQDVSQAPTTLEQAPTTLEQARALLAAWASGLQGLQGREGAVEDNAVEDGWALAWGEVGGPLCCVWWCCVLRHGVFVVVTYACDDHCCGVCIPHC